jgi:hypothetical protein
MRARSIPVLTAVVVGMIAPASCADLVLGITWSDSWLVSFDPRAGVISQWHTQLDPNEDFRGLAYDSRRRVLYACAQVSKNLYAINPRSLHVRKIGTLPVPGDVSSLAYDPISRTLYAAAVNVEESRSQLYAINPANARATLIGDLPARYVNSISYNAGDGYLHAYAVDEGESSDSEFHSRVVRIDPADGSMTTLFETPYHTILGLAQAPGEDTYYAWINSAGHWYGLVDIGDSSITLLADSDAVGVTSDAMIYRDFFVAAAPPVIPLPGALLLGLIGLGCMRCGPRRQRPSSA